METISVKGIRYYSLDDITENHLDFSYGTKNNKNILEKNNVPEDQYIQAIKKNKKWIKMDNNSKNNKILIAKQWFKNNYDFENETKDAPELLEIEDDEKFKDSKGDSIEIEMRGERCVNNCYFLASDVGNTISSKTSVNNITKNSKKTYKLNKDYKYFYVLNEETNKRKKKLFLTFAGLMTLLKNSKNPIAKEYIDWSNETLFTIKYGTTDSKIKLVSQITGSSTQSVKCLFGKFIKATPCLYLFILGIVADLRSELDIGEEFDDDDLVIKWGRTEDMKKRTSEHESTYGSIEGVKLNLEIAGWIDPMYLVKAEAEIKKYMINKNYVINTDETKFEELAAIPKKQLKKIKEVYKEVTGKYSGLITDIREENMNLKKEVEYCKDLVAAKEDTIKSKEDTIKSKDEIIELLRDKLKNLEKNKK